jgi:uncharacterized glyoxalase superfamily protein PhnB
MQQSISFVTLAVHDFDEALGFYRGVLGWTPFNVIDHTIAFFNVGSLVFSLCAYEELRNDVGSELVTTPFLGVTLALNLPSEVLVNELFAQLHQAGVNIVKSPTRASWGGFSGYFADPEGHLWEVAYNPQFAFAANGTMVIPQP